MPESTSGFQPVNVPNLRVSIENEIRGAILRGAFQPGERIVESSLADQLRVSRAPVREVLSALEREGLISNVPRRGYFAIKFTDKDIEEIYGLRILLESAALQRAIVRSSDEEIAEIQAIVDEIGAAVEQGSDSMTVVALDLRFHESLCRAADHTRLFNAWNSIRWQTQLLMRITTQTHYRQPREPQQYHQRILDAIRTRDLAEAQVELSAHINDAMRRARDAMESLLSDPAIRSN